MKKIINEFKEFINRGNVVDMAVGVMIGADCTVPTDIDDNRLEWVRQASIKYAETH